MSSADEEDFSSSTQELALIFGLLFGLLIPIMVGICGIELFLYSKKKAVRKQDSSRYSGLTTSGKKIDISNVLKSLDIGQKVELLSTMMSKTDKLKSYAETKLLNLHYIMTSREEELKANPTDKSNSSLDKLAAKIRKVEKALDTRKERHAAKANRAKMKQQGKAESKRFRHGVEDVMDFSEAAEGDILSVLYPNSPSPSDMYAMKF